MPYYYRLGEIPKKKHTTFYQKDGKKLFREELVSTKGFSGVYSTKYHYFMPTRVLSVRELPSHKPAPWENYPLAHMHFRTKLQKEKGNYILGRRCYLHNRDCRISIALISENTEVFFRNAYHYEVIFIHHGRGIFRSEYGKQPFGPGDQINIPKGTLYHMEWEMDEEKSNKMVVVESTTPFEIPRHYITESGQLAEDAPYWERDLRPPEYEEPKREKGEFKLHIQAGWRNFEYTLDHHPLDVVGWDGFLYPYILNIRDFSPKVGKIHLPPPVHLVFQTQSFVYCNFCPRLFDFHPEAIPAPYVHHNVDSDEVLYYVEGNFMSRKGVEEGSITLHPTGIPHGPQPGKTEESIGKKETLEYALMVDTFAPLSPTLEAQKVQDETYFRSWLTDNPLLG